MNASIHSREWGANAAATMASGALDAPLRSPRFALLIRRSHTMLLRSSGNIATWSEELKVTSFAVVASRVLATSSKVSLSAAVFVVTTVGGGVGWENVGVPRRRQSAVAAASAALVSSR